MKKTQVFSITVTGQLSNQYFESASGLTWILSHNRFYIKKWSLSKIKFNSMSNRSQVGLLVFIPRHCCLWRIWLRNFELIHAYPLQNSVFRVLTTLVTTKIHTSEVYQIFRSQIWAKHLAMNLSIYHWLSKD